MSFYRDTIRKARKQHECELCGVIIEKGETYHDKAGVEFDGLWSSRECNKCRPIIIEFLNSEHWNNNEGYNEGLIREWWMDEKCDVCKCKYTDDDDVCEKMTHYCRCEKFEVEI